MWVPGTHVPLLAVYGDRIRKGAVSDVLVDFSDFLPTLAEVAGLQLDRYPGLDGQSFLHHLTGEPGPEREWIYCHYVPGFGENSRFETGRMVYGKRYKLYRQGQVFDIENDFLEKQPLPPDDPVVEKIRAQYGPVFETRPSWETSLARMKGVDSTARDGGNR
jgi:arylsulfatase A-like enzyme